MKPSFPVQIYPSQLKSFKEKSNELAEAISKVLPQKKLSSFKRNDYLAIGLGYKSHDDLIDWANSRKQADQNEALILFADPKVCHSIRQIFCLKVDALNTPVCSSVLKELSISELTTSTNTYVAANGHNKDSSNWLFLSSPPAVFVEKVSSFMPDHDSGKSYFKNRAIDALSVLMPALFELRDNGHLKLSCYVIKELLDLNQFIKLAYSENFNNTLSLKPFKQGEQIKIKIDLTQQSKEGLKRYLASLPEFSEELQLLLNQSEQVANHHGLGKGYILNSLDTISRIIHTTPVPPQQAIHVIDAVNEEDFHKKTVEIINHKFLIHGNNTVAQFDSGSKIESEYLVVYQPENIQSALRRNISELILGKSTEDIESLVETGNSVYLWGDMGCILGVNCYLTDIVLVKRDGSKTYIPQNKQA